VTPHEERLLFRALAAILEIVSDGAGGRVYDYPDRALIEDLKKAAGASPSFLGKDA